MRLNKNTQKAENYLSNYNRSNASELWQVYERCSNAKIRSFEAIKEEMHKNNGFDLRITGHNTCTYTCAYLMSDCDGVIIMVYHTPSYRYEIEF